MRPWALVWCLAAAGLALAGCAAAQPAPVSPAAEAVSTPATTASALSEVSAPRVLGNVEVRSARPADSVAARVDEPVRLQVAAVDIDMPVVPVGVDDAGGMVIPEGAMSAGWYRFGPAPGDDAGRAVLAAHVDNAQGTGPFSRLRDVEVGEQITVTTDAGHTLAYVVDSIEQTDKDEVDLAAVFDPDGAPALVLVTCGGDWQPDIRHYADNVIVTAIPVDDVP